MHSFFSLIVFYFEYIPFSPEAGAYSGFCYLNFCLINILLNCRPLFLHFIYGLVCLCICVWLCVCVECVCVQLCMWSVYVCGVCMCVVMCVECIYILHFSFKDYVIQVSMKRLFWKLVFPSLHVEIKR